MKRFLRFLFALAAVALLAGCTPVPYGATPSPGPLAASGSPTATLTLPLSASPPSSPQLTSTAPAQAGTADAEVRAMRRDIDFLISRSDEQRGQEENYKNLKKDQYLTVERVTDKELKFKDKPQIFKGDYTGQLTAGKKYQYFEDASMGGKRYYNVKDNYGVWITFMYQVPIQ